MITELTTQLLILRAYWRSYWLVCPKCNSDAPAKDACTVCMGGNAHNFLSESPALAQLCAGRWLTNYFHENRQEIIANATQAQK